MKKILAFLLILIIAIPSNVCFVFASDNDGVLLSEDFNDYTTQSSLPYGFSLIKVDESTTFDSNPYVFGYGNDTALKLTSKGATETYIGADIASSDITKGMLKMSFQIYLEDLGRKSGSPQVIHIYGGKGESTPYVKGMRISNGKVQYASSESNRWTHADTTFSVEPLRWYTFDVISDFDNNKTYYYMDGKPFVDAKTSEVVVTPCYELTDTKSVKKAQILVRTHHPDAEGTGGDIFIDNFKVSSCLSTGISAKEERNADKDITKFDIKFNNSIDTSIFEKNDVRVTLHTSDDVMLSKGEDVSFTLDNLSGLGCEILLDSAITLDEYEKIKIDFGTNKDFLGNNLGYSYVVELPEKKEAQVLYDSETAGDYSVEISGDENISATDYNYTQNSVNKSAKIYTASSNITSSAKIDIKSTDSTKNLFDEGSVYNLSFKMKILQNKTSSQLQYNIRGYFGEGTYIKDGSETTYDEGAARMIVYLTHVNENPRIYNQTNPSATVSTTKVGSLYSFNSDASITTTNALFEKQKWLDIDLTYYPDTKLYDVTFTTEDGTVVTKELQNAYYMDISHSTYYKSAPKDEVDGGLKSIQFMLPKSGTILLDDLLLTKSDIPQSDAAIKNVVLKDEKGNVVSSDESGTFDAGIKEIEIYFDGAVDENKIYDLTFTGSNIPVYSTDYDKIKKLFTISLEDGACLGGNGNYSINLPSAITFKDDITKIDFSTSEGDVEFTNPVITLKGTTAFAKVYAKNTTFDVNAPATFVIASYKNGEILNVEKCDLAVNKCSYKNVTTGEIALNDADTLKAFVLKNENLVHISEYAIAKISDASDVEKTYTYKFSGDAEGEYVTSVLMCPKATDKEEAYTLDNLADVDSTAFIDVLDVVDGKFNVEFDINASSGKYELYVVDQDGTNLLKKVIFHSDAQDAVDAQILLNKAVSDYETSSEVLNVLNDYEIDLGLMNIDLYKNIDKQTVADMLYTSVKNEQLDVNNPQSALKRVGDIVLIDALNNKKITDIANYAEYANVFDEESIKIWYEKGIADSAKITTRLLDKSITMNNFADKMMEAIALEVIDEGNGYENVKQLCELLEDEIGIDSTKGSAYVYRLMDSKEYIDYAALKFDFETLTNTYQPSSSGSSGGGGGGKGSVGTVTTPNIPLTSVPTPLKQHSFKDIAQYEWAIDSIQNLYDKNIISGRSKDTFAPAEVVLREEFVKMIVEAFEISGSIDVNFEDVSTDAWFKSYIQKAYGAKIISGEGNTFGVGKSITRQDMAKIIYQAALYKGVKFTKADITGLDDYDSISSYAHEAISNLYNAGIIKGKSENTFAPKDFATRAEAAVIVSRALALLN